MLFLLVGVVQRSVAQGWYSGPTPSSSSYSQSKSASLTIRNRSSYSLTVKILRTNGRGLYTTVYISPQSSTTVSFSRSDSFFTKTKAVKGGIVPETLYRKGGSFSVQCDGNGYTEGTLEFFVSSGGGASGKGISKAEFDSNR